VPAALEVAASAGWRCGWPDGPCRVAAGALAGALAGVALASSSGVGASCVLAPGVFASDVASPAGAGSFSVAGPSSVTVRVTANVLFASTHLWRVSTGLHKRSGSRHWSFEQNWARFRAFGATARCRATRRRATWRRTQRCRWRRRARHRAPRWPDQTASTNEDRRRISSLGARPFHRCGESKGSRRAVCAEREALSAFLANFCFFAA